MQRATEEDGLQHVSEYRTNPLIAKIERRLEMVKLAKQVCDMARKDDRAIGFERLKRFHRELANATTAVADAETRALERFRRAS